jgi:hypothetical protein
VRPEDLERDGKVLRRQGDGDSMLEPLPGREECDFCGDGDPVWVYGAGDARIITTSDAISTEDQESVGGWLACEKCKFLIDRSEVKKLADRCAVAVLDRFAAEGRPLPTRASLRRSLLDIQQAFWKNRRRAEDRPFVRRQHGQHGRR